MTRSIRAVPVLVAVFAMLGASRSVQAADPTTADCLSASEKSISLRNDHKLRAARSQLLVCAAANCPADIRKECVRRVDEVNASMPTILFEAKDAAGNDLSAVRVSMDGEELAARLEGTAVSLDPGAHAFTFETQGQPKLTKQLVIREGEKDRRELVRFGDASAAAVPPPIATGAGTGTTTAPPSLPPPLPPEAHHGSTQKVLAVVAGGIGLVGIGVGTAFGLQALSKHKDAENACPSTCTTPAGVSLWHDAVTAGNLSTVAFIVGGVGIASAAVLWLTAGSSNASSTQVGVGVRVGPGSFLLRGVW